jgi:phosphoribosylaminoimidazole-succinocarboxamide synthase
METSIETAGKRGKSKIVTYVGELAHLEFLGDAACSGRPTVFDPRIAAIRCRSTLEFFNLLRRRIPSIPEVREAGENRLVMRKLDPLPLEWIPRFFAAGSVVKRFGFVEGSRFGRMVLKIDFKSEKEDYLINDDLIIESGLLNASELLKAKELVGAIADFLREHCEQAGFELWDFKVELGLDENRDLALMDEISFDGMRLKKKGTGISFDKDIYRKTGDLEKLVSGYQEGFRALFGYSLALP